MGAIIVVDAFWGDSGKGKVAAFLAQQRDVGWCVRAGTGTNAGHSLWLDDRRVIKTHQLPLGGLTGGALLGVGSGVVVDPRVVFAEIEAYDAAYAVRERVRIDYRCALIEREHIVREQQDSHLAGTVGSTCSGTGAARSDFVLRRARQARDEPALAPFLVDIAREVNEACGRGEAVVVEGTQGTLLSLALSPDYPCCTSDNCTTAALADDIGLNWRHIDEVVLVVKALPSRVGTGPLPMELGQDEQDRRCIAEFGVRTGRRRRKASGIDWDLLEYAVMLNGPTSIALTFCDHYDPSVCDTEELTPAVVELIETVEHRTGVPVSIVDTGKRLGDCRPYPATRACATAPGSAQSPA